MRTRITLAALALALWLPAAAMAHPGHGEVSLLKGTIVSIEATRVQLEVFDRASASVRRIWVIVDETTGVRSGKARLSLNDLRAGAEVECASETDEGPDGATILRAVTFRFKAPKK